MESSEFPIIPSVPSVQPVLWVGSSQRHLSQQPYLQLQGGAATLRLVMVSEAANLCFCCSQLYVVFFSFRIGLCLHAADKPDTPEHTACAAFSFVGINNMQSFFFLCVRVDK